MYDNKCVMWCNIFWPHESFFSHKSFRYDPHTSRDTNAITTHVWVESISILSGCFEIESFSIFLREVKNITNFRSLLCFVHRTRIWIYIAFFCDFEIIELCRFFDISSPITIDHMNSCFIATCFKIFHILTCFIDVHIYSCWYIIDSCITYFTLCYFFYEFG